jgi:hypothetical protein
MRCGGRARHGTNTAADAAADSATGAAGPVLRRRRGRRERAGERRGCEGCEANARMPHGMNSHVARPTQYLKVVQSVFSRKASRVPTGKNHIDDWPFRMTGCSKLRCIYRNCRPARGAARSS